MCQADVTAVAITAPTTAAPAFVKVGAVLPVTFSTDGTDPARSATGWAVPSNWQRKPSHPGRYTMNLTIPAGTADGPWDLSVEAKNIGQDNWVAAVQPTSVIVDSTLPVVAADTLIQPNGGEYLGRLARPMTSSGIPPRSMRPNFAGIDLEPLGSRRLPLDHRHRSGQHRYVPVDGPGHGDPAGEGQAGCQGQGERVRPPDESNAVFTIFNTDNTPPVVNVTAPPDNAFITTNTATVAATATDVESGITKVVFEYPRTV